MPPTFKNAGSTPVQVDDAKPKHDEKWKVIQNGLIAQQFNRSLRDCIHDIIQHQSTGELQHRHTNSYIYNTH